MCRREFQPASRSEGQCLSPNHSPPSYAMYRACPCNRTAQSGCDSTKHRSWLATDNSTSEPKSTTDKMATDKEWIDIEKMRCHFQLFKFLEKHQKRWRIRIPNMEGGRNKDICDRRGTASTIYGLIGRKVFDLKLFVSSAKPAA